MSIKANHSGAARGVVEIAPNGDRIVVSNSPMSRIVAFAFDRQRNDLILGLPDWTREERWDIEAKIAPSDVPAFQALSFREQKSMLQSILAERCKLLSHSSRKEVPVYLLTLARGGSKLRQVRNADPDAGWDFNQKPGEVHARAAPIAALLFVLAGASLDRQIVDKSGLADIYAFDLEWTPQDQLSTGIQDSGSSELPRPSLFTALQEQLGLQLVASRAQVDALVVDHIEKPSPN